MLARDMQSVVLYDQEGKFAGVRRPNSKLPIDIDGIRIVVLDAIGSTGLDIKVMKEYLHNEVSHIIFLRLTWLSFHFICLNLCTD